MHTHSHSEYRDENKQVRKMKYMKDQVEYYINTYTTHNALFFVHFIPCKLRITLKIMYTVPCASF